MTPFSVYNVFIHENRKDMAFNIDENRCGDCTLCCELLPINWLNKPANVLCKFCDKGCAIHATKDKECKNFECAYFQSKNAHIDLRPDNSKIIFEKASDNIMFGLQDPRYDVTDVAKKQISAFLNEGFSVVLKSTKYEELHYFVNKKHNKKDITIEMDKIMSKK